MAGVAIWSCFVWLGVVRLDPDYGWHVRMGEYITAHGIPKTDPFSYTMANFPFIDHEWATNLMMYWGDKLVGKPVMAMVSATLVFLVILISVPKKFRRWMAVPGLLAFSIWWPRAGVRPQVEDWVFLPVVMRLVGDESWWKRWKWLFPLLMLFWANLHGGFVVGLAVGGTIAAVKMIENRRWRFEDTLVFVVAGLATLVNPYGIRLWGEVWQQLSDRKVGKIIAEWQPFYAEVELGWVFMISWVGTLGFRYWKKVEKWKLVVVAATFAASISSLRHGALFAVTCLPLASELMANFYEEFRNDKVALARLGKFYKGIVVMAGIVFMITVGQTVVNPMTRLSEGYFYPTGAIEYLKDSGIKGNLYTDYGWGGYMDWKMPEVKGFIDGRMATWKWKSPDPTYSDYVFDEYLDITFRGKWQPWFDKYGIATVVLPVPRTWPVREWLRSKLQLIGINFSVNNSYFGLTNELRDAKWRLVYSDEAALVFERP